MPMKNDEALKDILARADIQKALDGMRWALEENSAEDAAEIYREF